MSSQTIPQDIDQVVRQAIEHHGATREGLIPIMGEINRVYGYIPAPAYEEVQRQLNVPGKQVFVSKSQLFALASFYHMLSTEPLGEHVVRFCYGRPGGLPGREKCPPDQIRRDHPGWEMVADYHKLSWHLRGWAGHAGGR
jgi:NADH:ubiquinone oxidoreductase subunit E